MKEDYRIISVNEYFNLINNFEYLSITEVEIDFRLGNYFLCIKRNETNAKIVESLIA